MSQLIPPDTHHLLAAQGWLELGNQAEAELELEKITPELQTHPLVLEMQWQVQAEQRKWDKCVEVAAALVKTAPENPSGWIHRAYALRRVAGGGLKIAFDSLRPAVEKFPEVSVIPYNLACYTCQMNDLDEARNWLAKAFANSDAKEVKKIALSDSDLEILWPEISKM